MEPFADPVRLPCSHVMCRECLSNLRCSDGPSSASCPTCRSELDDKGFLVLTSDDFDWCAGLVCQAARMEASDPRGAQERHQTARDALQLLADRGEAPAQEYLWHLSTQGIGTPVDPQRALEMLKGAAEQSPGAAVLLTACFEFLPIPAHCCSLLTASYCVLEYRRGFASSVLPTLLPSLFPSSCCPHCCPYCYPHCRLRWGFASSYEGDRQLTKKVGLAIHNCRPCTGGRAAWG